MRAGHPAAGEAARGINRIEGYLLAQAERDRARAEAEAFADRLPWLTAGERDEVVRLYAAERMELCRRVLHGVSDRCAELREEYTEHYGRLRRRLFTRTTVLLLTALCLTGSALLTSPTLLR